MLSIGVIVASRLPLSARRNHEGAHIFFFVCVCSVAGSSSVLEVPFSRLHLNGRRAAYIFLLCNFGVVLVVEFTGASRSGERQAEGGEGDSSQAGCASRRSSARIRETGAQVRFLVAFFLLLIGCSSVVLWYHY